jgi:hypothetical protein
MMQVDISNDVFPSSQRISRQGAGHDNLGYEEGTKRIDSLTDAFGGVEWISTSAMHMV